MAKIIPTGKAWIKQIFKAQAVKNGGIVRRKVDSVKKFASVKDLKAEVKRRKFHMLQTGDQYLIICNPGYFRTIC